MHGNHLGVFWYGRPQYAARFVYHIASCFLVLRSLVESCVLAIAPAALCCRVILVSDVIGSNANAANESTSVRYSTGGVDAVAVAVACGKAAHFDANQPSAVESTSRRRSKRPGWVQFVRESALFISEVATKMARYGRLG